MTDATPPSESGGSGDALLLHVRRTDGTRFDIEIATTASVADIMTAIAEETDIAPEQQRLVWRGQILKASSTVESYGILNNHTIHLVKGAAKPKVAAAAAAAATATPAPAAAAAAAPAAATTTPTNPFAALGALPTAGATGGIDLAGMQRNLMSNPDMLRSVMDSPLMQNMMSNPELMRSMMLANPQTRALIEAHPELNEVLSNPDVMRQAAEAARNPEYMAEMMRNNDVAMRNIESMPGGFSALSRMYNDVQAPLMDSMTAGGAPGSAAAADTTPDTTRNTSALPNPWASATSAPAPAPAAAAAANPFAGFNPAMLSAMMGGAAAPASAAASGTTPAASATTTPAAPAMPAGLAGMFGGGGAPNLAAMSSMLQNPTMQSTVASMLSNPAMVAQMEASNPMLANMLAANPQLRTMLSNPDFVRQSLAMASMMGGPGGMPSPFGGATPAAAAATPATSSASTPAAAPGFDFSAMASLFGGPAATAGAAPATAATPAPTAAPAPAAPAVDPAVTYASELTQLHDMGFTNDADNIPALVACQGNVQFAIERLLR